MNSKIKKIVSGLLIFTMVFISCSCSRGGNWDIEGLLKLKNKSDIYRIFGKAKDETESYDITFMDRDVTLLVDYDDSENIERINLGYHYEGMKDIELAVDMISYIPTYEDLHIAGTYLEEVNAAVKDMFGYPDDIYLSPIHTETYTWECEGFSIEVTDQIGTDLGLVSAVGVRIEY